MCVCVQGNFKLKINNSENNLVRLELHIIILDDGRKLVGCQE